MNYTMLNDDEEQKLKTFEGLVVKFVRNVLGSSEWPMWAGGTAGESRMVRLVVAGQMPPVILELPPGDIPSLTEVSLTQLLNAQISQQRK